MPKLFYISTLIRIFFNNFKLICSLLPFLSVKFIIDNLGCIIIFALFPTIKVYWLYMEEISKTYSSTGILIVTNSA